jgi:putative Ca2+/H+ antiporter (TMEM165/GDT1 family)
MPIIIGPRLGMVLANVPVVFAGERLARKLPLALLRRLAAALFALMRV